MIICFQVPKDVKLFFETENTCSEIRHESWDMGKWKLYTVRASSDIDWFKEQHPKWTALKSIVAVTAQREIKRK